MKKTNQQLKLIASLIYLSILVVGSIKNPLLIPISLCYTALISFFYYFGSKIKDIVINIGYVWLSKWALFVVALSITGIYAPDVFLYAMMLFVVFNITINPTILMTKRTSIRNYRTANMEFRDTPEPSYFNDPQKETL